MLDLLCRRALTGLAVALALVCSSAAQPLQPLPGLLQARTPPVPPAIAVLALVRTTLLAVDQANKTGNYTVLRDLSGPDFHDTNDAARLAQIFAPLRTQNLDLLAVSVAEPEYKEPPRVNAKKMLYVAGRFTINPRPVNFELLFQVVRGQWHIYGISIVPA